MSHNAEKKLKGGTLSLAQYCMLRGKKGKTFLVQFLGQQVHFGDTVKFYRTFGRTISVTSGASKKNRQKAMTTFDSFLKKSSN